MIVVFNATEFRTFYPKFTEELISDEQLDNLFQLACTFIDNTDKSRFPYDPNRNIYTRKQMLYLLVCHLATMELWGAGQSGPLTSATQGSVSVGFQSMDMWGQPWFSQTPCGRTLLQMLMPYALGGRIFTKPHFHPYG
jgi:hypothetical protein